ncbi:MAG: S8 family serine peptidase, partial [Anaerolineaceae bacterium]
YDPTGECLPAGVPCDNHNHGTHVTGIMVGETADGSVQIGVAPEAKWIAVKACTGSGSCSRANVIAAAQWLLAPTDVNGNNPRPDLRPDIINNSWGTGNYADDPEFFRPLVQAWVAAGIFPVAAQGNLVSGCGHAFYPGLYPETMAVGSLTSAGLIAPTSNKGPSAVDGTIKPDIAAPGVGIYSSIKNSAYGTMSGTSMAAPHVSGAVALLWSYRPDLRGNITFTRTLLGNSAPDVEDLTCGGTAASNNVYGMGKLNIFDAVRLSELKYKIILILIMKNSSITN